MLRSAGTHRDSRVPASVALFILACGPSVSTDDGGNGDASSDASSADASSTDASSGDSPEDWPPATCPPASSPFVSGECLDGLARGCGAYADENACAAAPVASFDGYTVRCRWATVTTIADPQTCALASVGGRCVAALEDDLCLLPCTADPSTNEIIEVCGGPLDASAAVGAEPDDDGPCSTQQTSPPAPALCECAPASCASD